MGLQTKLICLVYTLIGKTLMLFFLSETKLLQSDLSPDYFKLSSYNIYRKDRNASNRGGGVCLLIHNNLCAERLNADFYGTETVACLINCNGKKLLTACIYRPPQSGEEVNVGINNTIEYLAAIEANQYLICGDFNYPRIDWINYSIDTSVADQFDRAESRFIDSCQDSFLFQHVQEFTRKRGLNEPSLLDLVFTKNELEIDIIKYDAPIAKSDHAVLIFDYELEGHCDIIETKFEKRKYDKGNYVKINEILVEYEWQDYDQAGTYNKWNLFLDLYVKTTDENIPKTKSNNNQTNHKKWTNHNTTLARVKKEETYSKYMKYKTEGRYQVFREARNISTRIHREAKEAFEMRLAGEIEQGDYRGFYAYMRSQTTIKESVNRVMKPDGTLTLNLKETADIINSTFHSVFIDEGDTPIPDLDNVYDGPKLQDIDFNVVDVYEILKKLKVVSTWTRCSSPQVSL